MSSIYDEAIADARELVRMAEENATNKLIEAVAPRIRKIVEKRLMQEAAVDEEDDLSSIITGLDDDTGDEEAEVLDAAEMGGAEDEDEDYEEDYDFDDDDDDDSSIDFKGSNMASLPLKGVKKINIEFEGEKILTDEGVELNNESINTLLGIIDGRGGLKDRIREARIELKLLGRALNALNEGRTSKTAALRIVENFNNVLKKSLGYQAEISTLSKGKLRESSSREMSLLLKEIKQMSTRSLLRNLLEREERRAKLHEADDDAAEMGDDKADSSLDLDSVKSALQSLAAAVGMELKASDSDEDAEGAESEGDDDMEEGSVYEMEEADMEEMQHEMEETDMEEADMEEMQHEMQHESRRRSAGRSNTVYSVDESMLRKELFRLRRLREEIDPTSAYGGHPEKEFGAYDEVELNANVTESDSPKKEAKDAKKVSEVEKKAKKEAARADEAQAEKEEAEEKAMKEARKNRVLMGRLKEATAAINGLRRELNEQKLFNAKLLYVNKLMQNTSLPQTKLKAVVEALDSAKTLREANLLYKSLNESLSRTTSSLSESANRTVGSSSRSTRPGGMINESVGETDRWAVLAGIGNDRA